jgi:integrase/recombinase XerD
MGERRDRMVRDMDVRHFSGRTVEAYVAGVKGLAKYYRRAPDQLSDAEVQRDLLYIRQERQLSGSTCNQIRCALKFFYEVTVRRPQASLTVPPMRQAQKLPQILSREEVERIFAATRSLRERVLLMAAYGSGLRVSEAVALRPGDIDVERGVIRVEQGKGRKDRYTVLAERLVRELGQYYEVYGRPEHWVFPQRRRSVAPHGYGLGAEDLHHREAARGDREAGWHSCPAPRLCDPQPGSRPGSADVGAHARAHQRDHHDALPAHDHPAGGGADFAARPFAARQTTRGRADHVAHDVVQWRCRYRGWWWRRQEH